MMNCCTLNHEKSPGSCIFQLMKLFFFLKPIQQKENLVFSYVCVGRGYGLFLVICYQLCNKATSTCLAFQYEYEFVNVASNNKNKNNNNFEICAHIYSYLEQQNSRSVKIQCTPMQLLCCKAKAVGRPLLSSACAQIVREQREDFLKMKFFRDLIRVVLLFISNEC